MSARRPWLAGAGLLALAVVAPARLLASPPEGEAWTLRLEVPAVAPGRPGEAVARLASRGGYHVNPDYPASFRPSADSTATFRGPRVALAPADRTPCPGHPADACAVSLPIPFTAPASGEVRVSGVLAFSVCSAERCLIEKVPVLGLARRP